jgi:hypothetical protein
MSYPLPSDRAGRNIRLTSVTGLIGSLGMVGIFMLTGCASSIYGWQVRTASMPFSPSFEPAILQEEPVVLFTAVTVPGLRGNEVTLPYFLQEILRKVTPQWKVISPQEMVARLNREGLAAEYMRMKEDYEQNNLSPPLRYGTERLDACLKLDGRLRLSESGFPPGEQQTTNPSLIS